MQEFHIAFRKFGGKLWFALFILGLFQGNKAVAETLYWNVNPSTCVVNESGDSCRLEIQVAINGLDNTPGCLVFEDKQISCWDSLPPQFATIVTLNSPGQLSLHAQDGSVLLQQTLDVKSIISTKRKRRLRSPWSMF